MQEEEPVSHEARPVRFEDFYRANRDTLVRGLTLTLRDADLAAEAGDEAMVRAYQRWGAVAGYDNPVGWTYRVGLNWATSRLRKRRREVPDAAHEPATWDQEPFDPALARGIATLADHHRAVVVLRYFFDWSVYDIAQALDLREGTVKSRLHRALNQLRAMAEVTR